MTVELHGYQYSVYAWIARLTLHEKGVGYEWKEIDPFATDATASYLELHPFKRVPTLVHGNFVLYETGAITRYVDEAFSGPRMQPLVPSERARMNQITSVIDSYCYWPLVRQAFSHGVFRQRTGRPADMGEFKAGLEASPRVLDALEALAFGGRFMCGNELSLADLHLAPMIAYFAESPEGAAQLANRQRLSQWWLAMSQRAAFKETRPKLP